MNDSPILLAEDNPDDVLLTRRAFTKNGFDNPIIAVADGEACLQALLPEHGPAVDPALVLLDINLPKVGGLEVLGRLRSDPRTRIVPVVILTTSREPRDVLEGYRLGANSYVCKPVSFTTFVTVVRTLATYWLRVNEPRPRTGVAP
ncbi:response regulator [Actinospica sp. MGRD01-02]|uniref:Response regulator n=1 Tax=Actinospica acidithermotolerans TaxID=2828514 RepID=A0A941EI21_9ACTN|nr:response regulator [Actinospica acidithermotolerans]MBR7831188.1 response regulator [Actinospica acidithermotolerans]